MVLDRSSAATIVAGSILFLIAAFSPISRVFGTPDPVRKLEIITAAPGQWIAAQVLFAAGALVTAAGVALLASRFTAGAPVVAPLRWAAAALAVGALPWTWHVYLRAVDPARFTAGGIPIWLFAVYSLLTLAGLALLGVALLRMGLPPWVGRMAIGAAAAFLVLGLAFGDMPPFVYYGVTLVVGVVLLRAAAAGTIAGVAAP